EDDVAALEGHVRHAALEDAPRVDPGDERLAPGSPADQVHRALVRELLREAPRHRDRLDERHGPRERHRLRLPHLAEHEGAAATGTYAGPAGDAAYATAGGAATARPGASEGSV